MKKVLKKDINTGEIVGYYESLSQAARINAVSRRIISGACDGGSSAIGFKWEWAKYRYSCKWGKWWISGDL